MRSNSIERPPVTLDLGNGRWHYNYNVTEREATEDMPASFDYDCVEVGGKPTYAKCVSAIIRESYTADAEMALINKYNAYQQGVVDDAGIVEEYEAYLRFVAEVKATVRKDFPDSGTEDKGAASPRMTDVMRLFALRINTMELTDAEALSVKKLYPAWETGIDVKQGEKYLYEGSLWKARQDHTTQEGWEPSMDTASIWERIDEKHAGTADDPIPFEPPMELFNGKYYTQDGVKYLCNRDSGQALSYNLPELVGLYVELVE